MGPLYLIKRLAAFGSVVVLTSIVVLWSLVQVDRIFEQPRLTIVSDQVDQLARLGSPKIVLVGGSNLAYGMNSELLSEATGRPVMNMGSQVSLTLEFSLETIKPHIGENDIVILLAEYAMYQSPAWSTTTLMQMAATDFGSTSRMSWRQLLGAPRYLYPALSVQGQQLKRAISRKVYGKPSFAEGLLPNGDYVGHRGKPPGYASRPDQRLIWRNGKPSPRKAAYLEKFQAFCNEKGVDLLVSFAASAEPTMDEGLIETMRSSLSARHTVISDPWDYAYPDSAFFDFGHHLVFSMRDANTRQLIEDLKPHLEF